MGKSRTTRATRAKWAYRRIDKDVPLTYQYEVDTHSPVPSSLGLGIRQGAYQQIGSNDMAQKTEIDKVYEISKLTQNLCAYYKHSFTHYL